MSTSLPAIDVVDLFPEERRALLELLGSLTPEEWSLPTVCTGWSVKDVALHILGSEVGMISRLADGFVSPHFADGVDISTWDGLLFAINRQNDQWMHATRRMSPQLLLDILQLTGGRADAMYQSFPPDALGGPIDWAGPGPAPMWMHCAREYTERWVHQQHIRDAVGKPGLTDRRFFYPVLDAFCRAIPHTLRDTEASRGARVQLVITGEAGGKWSAVHEGESWRLETDTGQPADSVVTMDQDLAWRLFTKGIDLPTARKSILIEGDPQLAEVIITMVSILA